MRSQRMESPGNAEAIDEISVESGLKFAYSVSSAIEEFPRLQASGRAAATRPPNILLISSKVSIGV